MIPIQINNLDHIVLTVANIETTVEFYTNILGMKKEVFGSNRIALKFGNQKINLHKAEKEFKPKAQNPVPGSSDLCFITNTKLDDFEIHLSKNNIHIIEGPVKRTGANGKISSIYFRDPDKNLIEVSNYL